MLSNLQFRFVKTIAWRTLLTMPFDSLLYMIESQVELEYMIVLIIMYYHSIDDVVCYGVKQSAQTFTHQQVQ